MSIFDKLFNSKEGTILLSIIWGLGLASLFRKACIGRSCIVIKAPDRSKIQSTTYTFGDKCYRFKAKSAKCAP